MNVTPEMKLAAVSAYIKREGKCRPVAMFEALEAALAVAPSPEERDIRNAALEEAAKLIEEGFDRPGIAKKQDTCAHGKFGWEDCESCAAAAIRALASDGKRGG